MSKRLVVPEFGGPVQPSWTSPSSSVQGAYGAAVNQNAEDYDKIMGRYDQLFDRASANGNRTVAPPTPLTAQTRTFTPATQYSMGGRLAQVADQFSDMSRTGGYSDADIQAFRARGLSPIRAAYAAAKNNLQRQRAIQGGYSPNYGALQAKLARDQGYAMANHTNTLNAGIAERVAEGKRFGLTGAANLASDEANKQHQINLTNTEGFNRVNELNAADKSRVDELNNAVLMDIEKMNMANRGDSMSQALAATQGQANLYGTTPALTNMFGNQVLQSNAQNLAAGQAEANIRDERGNAGLRLAAATPIRRPRGGLAVPTF